MDINIYTILNKKADYATSTLIVYKDQKILIDCGLSSEDSFVKYEKYKHHLVGLDIILISSAELNYAGAQPFIVSKYNFTGKIFSTVPVKYMSSLNLHNFAPSNLLCSASRVACAPVSQVETHINSVLVFLFVLRALVCLVSLVSPVLDELAALGGR